MQQLFRLLIFLIQPYMFRQEHFLNVYTAFDIMHRQSCRPVHCTKSCIYS